MRGRLDWSSQLFPALDPNSGVCTSTGAVHPKQAPTPSPNQSARRHTHTQTHMHTHIYTHTHIFTYLHTQVAFVQFTHSVSMFMCDDDDDDEELSMWNPRVKGQVFLHGGVQSENDCGSAAFLMVFCSRIPIPDTFPTCLSPLPVGAGGVSVGTSFAACALPLPLAARISPPSGVPRAQACLQKPPMDTP